MNKSRSRAAEPTKVVHCAIYARKSTEEGLEQEFNSLDAQRESGEAYIKSQANEGWQCLPTRYDDGGYTGGNTDRPALQRLMADIEAGKIDAVLVYKADRLSRSLLDFSKLMETFDKHHVSFVSVTQQFNTATSMGRLVLNVLLSFAQFERELISERTRDKIAATRRKGKWTGGHPLLGYDVDPERFKLIVNKDEAARVRTIFELYLEHQGLLPVVKELERRGWRNKQWTTRKGNDRGGKRFTKTSLYKLLTNIVYAGKIRYKDEVHDGEHAAIVDMAVWQRVQAILQRNRRTGGAPVRNKIGALLKGMLRCVPCGCAMAPSHTTKRGKRYRYYTCVGAQKRGWHTCPSKSIPAGEIERFVVERIKGIGDDPELVRATFAETRAQSSARIVDLETELRVLHKEMSRWNAEVDKLRHAGEQASHVGNLQERLGNAERRVTEINDELIILQGKQVDESEIELALAAFQPVWESLASNEQARVLQLLIEQVDYDGAIGKVAITFQPSGIKTLAAEWANETKEDSHELVER